MSGLKTMIAFQVSSVTNMPKITVSKADISDLSQIAAIEKDCFSIPFDEDDLIFYFNNPLWRFFVAKEEGSVLGYTLLRVIEGEGEIVSIATRKDLRGLGIGTMVIEAVKNTESDLELLHLEVRASNNPAIHLYEKMGFIPVGVSKNHYTLPTEDALRMTLKLK